MKAIFTVCALCVLTGCTSSLGQSERSQDCTIKGNIAYETEKKIYHVKGQKYYNDTTINSDFGEKWFCSESEARKAGWRKSKL